MKMDDDLVSAKSTIFTAYKSLVSTERFDDGRGNVIFMGIKWSTSTPFKVFFK